MVKDNTGEPKRDPETAATDQLGAIKVEVSVGNDRVPAPESREESDQESQRQDGDQGNHRHLDLGEITHWDQGGAIRRPPGRFPHRHPRITIFLSPISVKAPG